MKTAPPPPASRPPPPSAPPAILLMGPTASGKTAVAAAIAQALPCEIISVDSAQIYRHMDIGTAKPDKELLARAPHHLIDIIEPHESYSAARFRDDALALMREISEERGKIPLLAGGTMLYFKALFEGLDALPGADAAVRKAIEAEAAAAGWPALHAQLARVDPATAARLAPNDQQRIQRALEVCRLTGEPLSRLQAQGARSAGWRPDLFLSLEPHDRAWLHERIARRFDAMLAGGFLDEVRALRARGDLHPGLPSMRSVGYRQAWETLDGAYPPESLRERGIAATRQLAKRQLTWLRAMPQRQVVACDAPDALRRLLAAAGAAR